MPDSPAFPHLKTFYNIPPRGSGKGDTLHIYTAGGDGRDTHCIVHRRLLMVVQYSCCSVQTGQNRVS
jgi:hypothetical protein